MSTFVVGETIGAGGFGRVCACKLKGQAEEIYAIKYMDSKLSEKDQERFRREILTLSKLNHQNIIKIVASNLSSDQRFFIMPRYEQSLHQKLQTRNICKDEVISIVNSILNGLEYAHSEGVIHRDLKPENILLNGPQDVVISDFGLCCTIDDSASRLTSTSNSMGTLRYMAPEMFIDAKNADKRSDIFSLGRVLEEIHQVFTSEDSGIPDALQFIARKCMQSNKNDRYNNIGEILQIWNLASDATFSPSEQEINDVLIRIEKDQNAADIVFLCKALVAKINDSDFIHNTTMSLTPHTFLLLYQTDKKTICEVINVFCNTFSMTSWGFSYTDTIAEKCVSFFDTIDDADTKIHMTDCLLKMGKGHNRWHVLRICASLFTSISRSAFEVALISYLQQNLNFITNLGDYLEIDELGQRTKKFIKEIKEKSLEEV